ncbi:MAG: NAD(P)-dependent alcohol dehydrogenase [Alphaproteobacteria bacterium]|nr:NAD(P)-dependent alcohol dehydrogenase [Alphaproteobacteria bacterium]MBU1512788.1 NAD(P)-dependent alcohol dehydrogenase [Alphaproteobacteria bacterium]MBU2093964.1 NAD(P)-dependent alcohol dehydrogenase [Alphaproteobacteria bacterium]MBU2150008.1 NAD(P)-dependent alcohol dehydrogenase [Alphaproteobacteria bacterium]MBU2306451.1 NAD(P)-dependent alcohol dehydrogenase [Alphaproteobacteria bacterium]
MKAYRFDSFDSLDELRLREEADPRPQRGEVLVRVHAVSLNFRDIAMLRGRYPRKCIPGLIPTSDGAGEIVALGEGVEAFKVGDRVMGAFHPRWFGGEMPSTIARDSYGAESDGWLCELKALSQEAVVRLPDALTYEEGCTLPCAGLTAWTALTGPTPIRAGHTVLVQGSGGVSIFALQLARAVGATVIATTSSAGKAVQLRALGAAEVVNYVEDPEWGRRVRVLTAGRGVDRVVEVGGPGTIAQSLRAVALGGEIASIGFLSTENPGIDFFQLKTSGASFRNITVGDRAALLDLNRAVAATGLKPIVDRVFAFDEAREAFSHLERGAHLGKVVIRVS